MKKSIKILLIALGFSMLAVALVFLTSRPAPAQAPPPPVPVTVTNTTARPVPTTAVGRTTVSGSVIASQGTTPWTVSNALNPTSGASLPLLTQDVDSPGRNPFAVTAICQPNSAGVCVGENPILPSTTVTGIPVRTVVIDFVSAVCVGLASGITQDVFDFGYTLNTQRNVVFFPAAVESGTGKMAMRTVLYADPSSQTDLGTPGNNSGCSVSLSGHLILQ